MGLMISSKSVINWALRSLNLFLFMSYLDFLGCCAYDIGPMINQTSTRHHDTSWLSSWSYVSSRRCEYVIACVSCGTLLRNTSHRVEYIRIIYYVYTRNIHKYTGIYQIYTRMYIPGIYRVYIMIKLSGDSRWAVSCLDSQALGMASLF